MQDIDIPFAEAGQQDEAGGGSFGAAMPVDKMPSGKNYADHADILKQIETEVHPLIIWTRLSRQMLELEWQGIRRMEMQIHDEGQRYRGRSNSYLPIFSRILQTRVSSLSRGLFPSDEYMDVTDRGSGDPERAKPVKTYVQWEFEKNGKVRSSMKPFLRQYESFGNAVLKYMYKKELRNEGRALSIPDVAQIAHPEFGFKKVSYEGLKVSARSIFNWYIYPLTASSMDDATMVFEDIDVPLAYITSMAAQKRWINEDIARQAPRIPQHETNMQDQIQVNNNVIAPNGQNGGKELGDVRTLTEVWTYLVFPRDAYMDDEEPGTPLPARLVLAGNTPLEVTRNPLFTQKPPYLFSSQNAQPGFIYGYGTGRLARSMQYLSNDFANQTNDCGIYGLNPIVKINPGLVAGPLAPLRPGVVWPFTDIENGMKFDRPPVELVQAGLSMLNTFMTMTQDMAGAPPQISGIGGGKGSKTATGMQILQRNSMAPLQDVVEDIELDVLIPLMFGTWMLGQQFREQDIMASVAGENITIPLDRLTGDYDFRWLASSQAVNSQQRSQQAIQLLQAAMPMIPLLNQLGYIVDPAPILRRVFSDGMGFRGFSDFIRKAQAMPGGPMGPGGQMAPPGAMGGIQAEQQDRIRSTLEQSGGAPGDMVPGEGADFQSVRSNADDLAAQLGSSGGFEQ